MLPFELVERNGSKRVEIRALLLNPQLPIFKRFQRWLAVRTQQTLDNLHTYVISFGPRSSWRMLPEKCDENCFCDIHSD